MSLTLKVRIPATGATKSVRFPENMSVAEAQKTILEKLAETAPLGKDHGIFKPLNEDSGTKGGKWLRPEKTLESYDLRTNVNLYL